MPPAAGLMARYLHSFITSALLQPTDDPFWGVPLHCRCWPWRCPTYQPGGTLTAHTSRSQEASTAPKPHFRSVFSNAQTRTWPDQLGLVLPTAREQVQQVVLCCFVKAASRQKHTAVKLHFYFLNHLELDQAIVSQLATSWTLDRPQRFILGRKMKLSSRS